MNWLVAIVRTDGKEETYRCDDYEISDGILFLRNGADENVKYKAIPITNGDVHLVSSVRLQ